MADEPEIKTTSKKKSDQGRLAWLKRFGGSKRNRPNTSITQPVPLSDAIAVPEQVLDQDSPLLPDQTAVKLD